MPIQNTRISLRRIKWLASSLLIFCIALFIFAKLFEPRYPFLGFVAAFAEAATIGGCADWYAVVALFRHPLGLPIPHTAIIVRNQNRIADSLARFIGNNFLEKQPVQQKLQEVDFATHIAHWLSDETRTRSLAQSLVRLLPQLMQKADMTGLKTTITSRMKEAINQADTAPFVAKILDSVAQSRHHQKLLDGILSAFGGLIIQPQSLEAIGNKIRQELPSVFKFFKADTYLLQKIIGSTAKLIDDVQSDTNHPLRAEVDEVFASFIAKLKTAPEYHAWLNDTKVSLLNRPETAQLFQSLWDSLTHFIETDALREDSAIQQQFTDFIAAIARQLNQDEALQKQINGGVVTLIANIITSQKQAIAQFISNQVKAWDGVHMTKMIENSVGRDLQYIRFNGTLIGGAIGVALYGLKLAFGM